MKNQLGFDVGERIGVATINASSVSDKIRMQDIWLGFVQSLIEEGSYTFEDIPRFADTMMDEFLKRKDSILYGA